MVLPELAKLQHLSLVSKVCTELENHIGLNDKDLADFIIHLAEEHGELSKFQRALHSNGAEFPDSFVASLFALIQRMKPKAAGAGAAGAAAGGSQQRTAAAAVLPGGRKPNLANSEVETMFPGLSIPNAAKPIPADDEEEVKRVRDDDDDRADKRRRGEDGGARSSREEPQAFKKPKDIELYKIYQGKVKNVTNFGCFVELNDFRNKEGLVHVSQIVTGRISDPKEVVKRNMDVYVKIISIAGNKMGLSMKDVDQKTGRDLCPIQIRDEFANPERRKRTNMTGITITEEDMADGPRRGGRKVNSPDRWDVQQLVASGVLDITEHPAYDEEYGLLGAEDEDKEDMEIELNEQEPMFLKGQTRQSVQLSPIKIVKNPDGSLQRATTRPNRLAVAISRLCFSFTG